MTTGRAPSSPPPRAPAAVTGTSGLVRARRRQGEPSQPTPGRPPPRSRHPGPGPRHPYPQRRRPDRAPDGPGQGERLAVDPDGDPGAVAVHQNLVARTLPDRSCSQAACQAGGVPGTVDGEGQDPERAPVEPRAPAEPGDVV